MATHLTNLSPGVEDDGKSDIEDLSKIMDLTFLNPKSEGYISQALSLRFKERQYFTKIGARLLLYINPYDDMNCFSEDTLNFYLKNNTLNNHELNPHVYQLCKVIHFHLKRSGIDQSIIFNGDSGSGKSQLFHEFLRCYLGLRKAHRKESKLLEVATEVELVFNSFASCKTINNPKASKVGKYLELQLDKKGRVYGLKYLDYLLDKNRLVNVPRNETNFFVFYMLLAGVNQQESEHFKLSDASHYHYLGHSGNLLDTSKLSVDFHELKKALKSLGFHQKSQSQIFQLLATILHLGNLTFVNHGNTNEPALIKNIEVLDLCADMLGLLPNTLETLLTYKTQMIKKELCTIFLDAKDAKQQRDDLVKSLYSLLFSWLIEHINSKYCQEIQTNFIGMLDLPGFCYNDNNHYEEFCINYANERLFNYLCFQVFEASNNSYSEDGITIPIIQYPDNHDLIQLLGKPNTGIVAIMDKLANKIKGPATDASLMTALGKNYSHHEQFQLDKVNNQFTIHHFTQPITYSIAGFMEQNRSAIGADFVQTFRGGPDSLVGNPFVSGLFTSEAVQTETNPKNGNAIVAAQQPNIPLRKPSMKRKKEATTKEVKERALGALAQFQSGLDELFDTFDNTEAWFVLCMNSNLQLQTNFIENKIILQQIERYRLTYMTERKEIEYTVCYQHDEFVTRYSCILVAMGIEVDENDSLAVLVHSREAFGWGTEHMAIGHKFVYLCDGVWRDLEDNLKLVETQGIAALNKDNGSNNFNDNQSYYSDEDNLNEDQLSFYEKGSKLSQSQEGEIYLTKAENQLNLNQMEEEEDEDELIPKTKVRKSWICFTWSMTWWIPTSFLSCCGRMKLKEVKMAWREKVTLCFIIFLMCAIVVLFIVGINPLICPTRKIFSTYEVNSFNKADKAYVSIYGQVFDLKGLATHYGTQQTQLVKVYAGNDVSYLFPQQLSSLCNRYDGSPIDDTVSLQNTTLGAQDKNAQYHDHRYYRGSDYYQPDWYQNAIQRMKVTMKVGDLAVDPTSLKKRAEAGYFWVQLNERIYDLNSYVTGNIYQLTQPGQSPPPTNGYDFMDPNFIDLVRAGNGKDITLAFNKLYTGDAQTKSNTLQCLNNVFYAGVLDDRQSFRCVFAQYILLALSIFLFAILFVKFLASLQLGSRPEPEDHDRFVIINVPCYTEGEESLKKTIDSLAVLKYDDKRKLLFIVSDGMVMGGGNDKPTPRIVLDILGSDANNEPESLSFLSLGEGQKQHNMAKVYTGLYECYGHVVPYLVVVKTGKPSERAKPGNRGKRDSQLILMRFFNKVHYDYPMVPLELEMYHQIKNVIGVDPHFYEYVLMVDADTTVMPDSLNRMISSMLHDTKIMGLCGETALANEKDTWATMIQVYEYFISHHLAKAFESLFGSVTCLPGCFCMYRLRSPTGQPLLVHNVVVNDYSENRVDTLHKKNLLHLGEDRYLTTLMLKHFPFQKMTFTPDAMCLTNAPDTWDVLLSQRRRWINSTVHNLLELVFLPRLCGFCCFSMRFVVFMDLLSTVIMPATLGYLGYLLYRLITDSSNIPIISLAFILAPYVLQMIVFILRRQWQHIGWMIVYLLALPIFAFFIPIYAFWHFDDFSWGSTRIVVGENGKRKKVIVATGMEEGKFDVKTIPTKKWSEYEEEIWEAGTEYSSESKKSNNINKTHSALFPQVNNTNSMLFPQPMMNNPSQSVYQNVNHGPRSSNMIIGNMFNNNINNNNSRPGSKLNIANNNSMDFYNNNSNNNRNAMSMYNTSNVYNDAYPMVNMPSQSNVSTMNAYQRNNNANRSASGLFDYNQPTQGYLQHQYISGTESPKPLLSNDQAHDINSHSPVLSTPFELEVLDNVKAILNGADLMSITKKQVRDQLATKLNRDMQPHKELVNKCIEKVLQSQP